MSKRIKKENNHFIKTLKKTVYEMSILFFFCTKTNCCIVQNRQKTCNNRRKKENDYRRYLYDKVNLHYKLWLAKKIHKQNDERINQSQKMITI